MTRGKKWGITKEFIEKEYLKNKKSLVVLSRETTIPYRTLYHIKERYGIPTHHQAVWNKGKRRSPQTEFRKGQTPWNRGKKGITLAWNKGKTLDDDYKRKISLSTKAAMARPEIRAKIIGTQFSKGIIPWNKNRTGVYSEETLQQIRTARLRQIFPKESTEPEKILFQLLEELGLPFQKHAAIKDICQADALVKPNFVLFADGDYWHCNPRFYKQPITPAQAKNQQRDARANNRLIKENFVVLRFWEHELINCRNTCKEGIRRILNT